MSLLIAFKWKLFYKICIYLTICEVENFICVLKFLVFAFVFFAHVLIREYLSFTY